jgi:hypothetical protein
MVATKASRVASTCIVFANNWLAIGERMSVRRETESLRIVSQMLMFTWKSERSASKFYLLSALFIMLVVLAGR